MWIQFIPKIYVTVITKIRKKPHISDKHGVASSRLAANISKNDKCLAIYKIQDLFTNALNI
jgi:hypothetical protein